MKTLIIICLVCLIGMLNFSCSGSLQSVDSFEKIEPIEDLPQPTADHNLVVQLNNVADTGTSYLIWAEIYVNGKRIQLSKETVGYQPDYSFHFRLKSGIYKIKAVYYAKFGKDEREYKITTTDGKFRIYPDQRTVLSITLDKKLDGQLKSDKNYFTESTEVLATSAIPIGVSPAAEQMKNVAESRTIKSVSSVSERSNATSLTNRNDISLQIKVKPASAKIYLDGRLAGNSPLRVTVDRNTNHIVQISCEGYQTKTKYLSAKDLADRNVYEMEETLTKRK